MYPKPPQNPKSSSPKTGSKYLPWISGKVCRTGEGGMDVSHLLTSNWGEMYIKIATASVHVLSRKSPQWSLAMPH